ncbi:MAG: hypothetical protein IKU17_08945 [Clostridia bacterium]|nr:hypothetical protein [Clostridia bacterium]
MENELRLYADGAHDDTKALQALLDQRGLVTVPDGRYLISSALVLHDDTCLHLSHNAVICLADDACCYMLTNDRCYKEGRNHHITVEGGTWYGNNAHQRRGKIHPEKPYYWGMIMRFQGMEDLTVRDVTYKDPESYALLIMDADRFTVENITFDFNMLRPNMDGVHVQGPSFNGYIRNIKGATNDDLVALNCDDRLDDGEERMNTKGDIENMTVDGLYADNGYTAVRLLSCGSKMRNVVIRNVFGTYRLYGVSFTHHNIFPGAPVWFDGIQVDGVYCSKPPQDPPVDPKFIRGMDDIYGEGSHDAHVQHAPIVWFAKGVAGGNVRISNVHRIEKAVTQAHTVQIDEDVHFERLVLDNVTQRFENCPAMPLVLNNGQVDELITLP